MFKRIFWVGVGVAIGLTRLFYVLGLCQGQYA